ncbi:hypothetical protein Bca52824_089501 [Brassica carinata]|uniref:Uncharacterized protein n=1 Tax=Brassica carinata TaxID=52824 RepID=A0A8X7PFT7_BRACI|nr:hypothetical protein Bca52824_089501 [Brassica carinata]
MYSRAGSFVDARRVFDEKVVKDMISWNALLSGLSQGGISGLRQCLCLGDDERRWSSITCLLTA